MKMEKTTGSLRTPGEQLGVIKVSSRSKEVLTCAVLLFAILSHRVLKKLAILFSFNEKLVKL